MTTSLKQLFEIGTVALDVDRQAMAEYIFDLAAQFRTIQACYSPYWRSRGVMIRIFGPLGFNMYIRFSAKDKDVFRLTWSLTLTPETLELVRFSDRFFGFVAPSIDNKYQARARDYAYGFRDLYAKLEAGFAMIDRGEAIGLAGPEGFQSLPNSVLTPAPEPDPARLAPPMSPSQRRREAKKRQKAKAAEREPKQAKVKIEKPKPAPKSKKPVKPKPEPKSKSLDELNAAFVELAKPYGRIRSEFYLTGRHLTVPTSFIGPYSLRAVVTYQAANSHGPYGFRVQWYLARRTPKQFSEAFADRVGAFDPDGAGKRVLSDAHGAVDVLAVLKAGFDMVAKGEAFEKF